MVAEKRERRAQEAFGRACTLYRRTYAVYRDGKRQIRQTWQSVLPYMDSSFHNYIMNLRQHKSESIFASRYVADHGRAVHHGWELKDYNIDTSLADGYNVTVSVSNETAGARNIRW